MVAAAAAGSAADPDSGSPGRTPRGPLASRGARVWVPSALVVLAAGSVWFVAPGSTSAILASILALVFVALPLLPASLDRRLFYDLVVPATRRSRGHPLYLAAAALALATWRRREVLTDAELVRQAADQANQAACGTGFDETRGLDHGPGAGGQVYPVIRRVDFDSPLAHRRTFWIALLTGGLELSRDAIGNVRVAIDLDRSHCAIFGNQGKSVLRRHVVRTVGRAELISWSARIHAWLMGDGNGTDRLFLPLPVLRWASAGYIVFARWRGKEWVCLFFRDIFPVGWTLTVGASDNEDEQLDLSSLAAREMVEEITIARRHSRSDGRLEVRIHDVGEDPALVAAAELAARRVATLRREHDGLLAEAVGSARGEILPNHCTVVVRRGSQRVETPNCLVTIDPLELGVEVVRFLHVDLADNEIIMDGEIGGPPGEEFLVGRPACLISVDHLRRRFEECSGSLGDVVQDDISTDSKDIGEVPAGEYHLFPADLELRRRRLDALRSEGAMETLEARTISWWLDRLGGVFAEHMAGEGQVPLKHPLLTRISPPTWKCIEMALSRGGLPTTCPQEAGAEGP